MLYEIFTSVWKRGMVENILSVFMEGNNLIKNHFVVFIEHYTFTLGMNGKELNKSISSAFSFIVIFAHHITIWPMTNFGGFLLSNQKVGLACHVIQFLGIFCWGAKNLLMCYWFKDFFAQPIRQAELACRLLAGSILSAPERSFAHIDIHAAKSTAEILRVPQVA